ncbi:hypothetical protein RND71_035161 [Anisodus tanguticus]|uniref:Uncharacterized protein n=1 Tax=Anisodus tanguticus TaxID=243964 RepID=A0AAE1R4C4_9SOLA|nr:hypothetical protein RND71_035161 [Anisodus tanguticus]
MISFPIPFATTKPVASCLSVGVPRKFQLYSQLRNLDLDNNSTTNTGNLGKAVVVAAVKSGSVAEQNTKKLRAKYRQQGAKEVVEEEKQGKNLSGFDVLRALEKVSAQKMKKKKNGRDSNSLLSRKLSGQGRNGRKEDEDLADYGNKIVRPLNIKEDWGTRLDQLETRLQELVDTTTA